MALPSKQPLSRAVNYVQGIQDTFAQRGQRINDDSVAGAIDRIRMVNFYRDIGGARIKLNEILLLTGLDGYAQTQFDDNTLTATAEISAIISAIDAIITDVDSKTSGDSGFFKETQGSNGAVIVGTYGSGVLASVRPLLLNLVAACTPV